MLSKEELKRKYIRYSPNITEEIYNKILKRLEDLEISKWTNSDSFSNFKDKCRLVITGDGDYFIPTSIETVNRSKEISYKDIIGESNWWERLKKGDYVVSINDSGRGYKPNHVFEVRRAHNDTIDTEKDCLGNEQNGWGRMNFRLATPDEILMYKDAGKPVDVTTYKMKEKEFVLPEKWCIKTTYENKDILPKWRTSGRCNIDSYCHNKVEHSPAIGYALDYIKEGYTEISFEQFKKYVLKEEEPIKVGRGILDAVKAKNVEDTFQFIVGKWYKNIYYGEYIAKLTDVVTENKFLSSEYIYKKNYRKGSGTDYFRMSSCKEAVECPLEEIQQYLPDGHVDKLPTPIKSEKYSDYITPGQGISINQPQKISKLKISRNKKKRITNKKVKVSNKHLIIINE